MNHSVTQSVRSPLARIGRRIAAIVADAELHPDPDYQPAEHPGAFLTRGTSARRRAELPIRISSLLPHELAAVGRAYARPTSVNFHAGSLNLSTWTSAFIRAASSGCPRSCARVQPSDPVQHSSATSVAGRFSLSTRWSWNSACSSTCALWVVASGTSFGSLASRERMCSRRTARGARSRTTVIWAPGTASVTHRSGLRSSARVPGRERVTGLLVITKAAADLPRLDINLVTSFSVIRPP